MHMYNIIIQNYLLCVKKKIIIVVVVFIIIILNILKTDFQEWFKSCTEK